MARKSKSESNDGSTLHDKPLFFAEMFDLEKYHARYDPPAVL